MILVQRSNGPVIYEDSLDIICEFLILVQRSNGLAIYEESYDIISRFFYTAIYLISQPGVSSCLPSYWISQAGVEEPKLTFITA